MDQGLLTTLSRRNAQRICVRTDVGILDEGSGERLLGQLRDLSGTGACIKTTKALAIGKELRLAFEFEKGEAPIRVHAEVVWSGRSDIHSTGLDTGVRFLDLVGAEFGRLRAFIDRKLWTVQHFLSSIELLGDLNDLEKLLLASVSYDREVAAGDDLEVTSCEDSLILVRSGTLQVVEMTRLGQPLPPRDLMGGDFCGSLPIDPRGGSMMHVKAVTDSGLLCIPNDGFWYLWNTHSETALKLLSCWCLSLRDRLLTDVTVPEAKPIEE